MCASKGFGFFAPTSARMIEFYNAHEDQLREFQKRAELVLILVGWRERDSQAKVTVVAVKGKKKREEETLYLPLPWRKAA